MTRPIVVGMAMLKKYLPFLIVAAAVIYFYPTIVGFLPSSIRKVLVRAA